MTASIDQLSAALSDRYTIERLIGEGGMATVYLARDIRHNRRVALKVLRPDLGAVVGVDRFLAEIEVTANLQHPNLLPLFDSGAAGDLLFYVMPYVPGESLRARLDREKQLPVDEAIRLATAIGGALDYAHRQGVIHRDLKPENVLLQEGQPLVADFGIALAVSNAGGTRITQTGLSLGTPHYMSPEQATGDRVIDGRTDIYSLGALTYEMLTGEPPHVGSTSQAIIARVLTERPRSIRASRPSVPEHVEAAVERALEKLPADRWATARDFVDGLTGARPVTRGATSATTSGMSAGLVATPGAPARRPGMREIAAWSLAAAGIAVAAWAITRPGPEAPPMTRLSADLPDSVTLAGSNMNSVSSVALSRDGRTLAFVGSRRGRRVLFVRRIDDVEVRELAGTDGASSPEFSPDGKWIAFLDPVRTLRKIPVTGGTPQALVDTAGAMSWGDDGDIYFARTTGIWKADAEGSAPRLVAAADTTAGVRMSQPVVLPGSALALVRMRKPSTVASIALLDLHSGHLYETGITGDTPRYVAPGYLLYQSDNDVLSAVPFSIDQRAATGAPVRISEGVLSLANGGLDYAVTDNGSIAFRWSRNPRLEPTTLAIVDRSGTPRVIRHDAQYYDQPRLSPDGRYVIVRIGGDEFNTGDLWVLELASGALTRLTSGNNSFRPSWSRDGKKIYYMSGATTVSSRVMSKPWDGSGTESAVLKLPEVAEFAEGPPGGWSALRTYGARDILLVPTDSVATAKPRPFVTGPSNETDVALSPSGNLIAYQSDETGRFEVYVRPVPGPGPRVPVSIDGGTAPIWSPDGARLYFRSGTRVMAASISDTPALSVARRDSLFVANVVSDGVNIAVLPGGRGLLVALGSDVGMNSPIRLAVISNWQSMFTKGTATPNRP